MKLQMNWTKTNILSRNVNIELATVFSLQIRCNKTIKECMEIFSAGIGSAGLSLIVKPY